MTPEGMQCPRARSTRGRIHIARYIRQIPSAHVTINILHFRGLLYLMVADKSVIVAFNYHVLLTFVTNEIHEAMC